MSVATKYLSYATKKLEDCMNSQEHALTKAASFISESCLKGGRLYVFGSGHSHMVAEELYLRAGGLALVKGILPPELMLHEMPNKGTYLERLEGYAKVLIDLHKLDASDSILIISNSGRNPVPIEMCLEAKKLGVKVIAMTSLKHSMSCTSRHHSGKRLFELADVVLDNQAEIGDASYRIEYFETPIGPVSDMIGIALAQAMMVEAIDNMVKAGMKPPVFRSSNVDGAEDYNNQLFNQYYGFWK